MNAVNGFCLLCAEHGLADAILNILMFVPLGLLARLWFRSLGGAVILSVLLAAGIESTQVLLPGRDGSFGDVLFNIIGGGLGAIIPVCAARTLRAGRTASARLSLTAALIAALSHASTGWFLAPELPRGRYFSFWVPELEHLAPTHALLSQVTLAGVPLREGWVGESETVRRSLIHGRPLTITLDPGTATRRLGGFYALYDDRQREVLLVGRIQDDLVLRLYRRATRWRLDAPDIRVRGVLQGVGDRLTIRLERGAGAGSAYCVTWSQGPAPRCDLGFTVGRGWALLAYPEAMPGALRTLLDIAWVGLFFVPIGIWMRARPESVIAVALAMGSLVAVPLVSGLLPTPPHLYVAAAVGLSAGLPPIRRRSVERWLGCLGQDRSEGLA